MNIRPYQQAALDALYAWWMEHQSIGEIPLLVAPTGSGKSVTIAELVRLLFDTWPDQHPRTLVIVPSKELAEQNAQKLRALLPSHLSVGFYSASLSKNPDADVIVATIGSVYRAAHLLGNIKCVIVDEAHLINQDGKEAGRYRQFLNDLSRLCQFRGVGLTATPFRGNGIWLTDGKSPLFTGVAHTTAISELIEQGFLSPLVRPIDAIRTQIDVTGIGTTSGDFNIDQLSDRVEGYLEQVVAETMELAADRKKWIAFTPTVDNATHLVELFRSAGISAELVCGSTKKAERERLIGEFRQGRIRCLVTVLALATGFDVPDVDCVIWCRPTRSPVLYVQGAGRGMRIAPGKTDCLWLDFSDTTERMGPVDSIKGRKRIVLSGGSSSAPTKVCDECGELCSIGATICPSCGAEFPPPEEREARNASNAAIMASQIQAKINTYEVTNVRYSIHQKEGSPDSLRVDYYSGLRRVASEWVAFESQNPWARDKARAWWLKRFHELQLLRLGFDEFPSPNSTEFALSFILNHENKINEPKEITINESGKYPEIIKVEFDNEFQEVA